MTELAKKLLACIGDERRPTLPTFADLHRIAGGDTADSLGGLLRARYIVPSATTDAEAVTFAVTLLGMRALQLMAVQGVK